MDPLPPERLDQWLEAGLLSPEQAERIRSFEAQTAGPGHRRLAALASGLGALLVGAGVLLFVAAHWAQLGPTPRFLLVLAMVGGCHLAGVAVAARAPRLAMALHGLGTVTLGAGVYLAGQIFNLAEDWPGGMLLWALGAWMGFALLRDWVQGTLAALLTPAWLLGEWIVRMDAAGAPGQTRVLALACALVAMTYLSMSLPGRTGPVRRALTWVGGLTFPPAVLMVVAAHQGLGPTVALRWPALTWIGWAGALGACLVLALLARGRAAWLNAVGALWLLALAKAADHPGWWVYLVAVLGALGLVLWGLREARRERVNLGVAGFAPTVLAFYVSGVMDRLGRSLGLMLLGLLFLAGGWQLERLRRRLTGRIAGGAA